MGENRGEKRRLEKARNLGPTFWIRFYIQTNTFPRHTEDELLLLTHLYEAGSAFVVGKRRGHCKQLYMPLGTSGHRSVGGVKEYLESWQGSLISGIDLQCHQYLYSSWEGCV